VVVKFGCFVLVGGLLVQVVLPRCPMHDGVCEALGEPQHIHNEIPTGGSYRITPSTVQLSNNSPIKITLNLADNMAFWQDSVGFGVENPLDNSVRQP